MYLYDRACLLQLLCPWECFRLPPATYKTKPARIHDTFKTVREDGSISRHKNKDTSNINRGRQKRQNQPEQSREA